MIHRQVFRHTWLCHIQIQPDSFYTIWYRRATTTNIHEAKQGYEVVTGVQQPGIHRRHWLMGTLAGDSKETGWGDRATGAVKTSSSALITFGLAPRALGDWSHSIKFSEKSPTIRPSGLRRWLQAPVRKGVGSNPTAVTFICIFRKLTTIATTQMHCMFLTSTSWWY